MSVATNKVRFMVPPFRNGSVAPKPDAGTASIGFPLVEEFPDDHLDLVDGALGNLFDGKVNDFGVVAEGTLDLDSLNFFSHQAPPFGRAEY
jgi:hypothetical protein